MGFLYINLYPEDKIYAAVYNNDEKGLKKALKANYNAYVPPRFVSSPMDLALHYRNVKIISRLRKDVNTREMPKSIECSAEMVEVYNHPYKAKIEELILTKNYKQLAVTLERVLARFGAHYFKVVFQEVLNNTNLEWNNQFFLDFCCKNRGHFLDFYIERLSGKTFFHLIFEKAKIDKSAWALLEIYWKGQYTQDIQDCAFHEFLPNLPVRRGYADQNKIYDVYLKAYAEKIDDDAFIKNIASLLDQDRSETLLQKCIDFMFASKCEIARKRALLGVILDRIGKTFHLNGVRDFIESIFDKGYGNEAIFQEKIPKVISSFSVYNLQRDIETRVVTKNSTRSKSDDLLLRGRENLLPSFDWFSQFIRDSFTDTKTTEVPKKDGEVYYPGQTVDCTLEHSRFGYDAIEHIVFYFKYALALEGADKALLNFLLDFNVGEAEKTIEYEENDIKKVKRIKKSSLIGKVDITILYLLKIIYGTQNSTVNSGVTVAEFFNDKILPVLRKSPAIYGEYSDMSYRQLLDMAIERGVETMKIPYDDTFNL